MADASISTSVSQGFNFKKDSQGPVGHINKLKIGDKQFAVDIQVTNPLDVKGAKVKVVGVASQIGWAGGFAEPIQFACQVSNTNKQDAWLLTQSDLQNTEVKFSFTAYRYDNEAKVYFKSFHTNDAELIGLVQKSGDSLNLSIADDPSSEVQNPLNYTLVLGINPKALEQDVHLASSNDKKIVKKWGVSVGA